MVRIITTVAAAVATVLAGITAVSAEAPPGTVKYSFERKYLHKRDDLKSPDVLDRMLSKRQTVNTQLTNYLLLYVVNVTVGTPPQDLALIFDTGSSDIWFPAADSTTCQSRPRTCAVAGSYDSGSSSTFTTIPDYPQFQIAYVDGTETDGEYFLDTLNIGGTDVTSLTMARATTFDRAIGIMGAGFQAGESSNTGNNAFTYPNIVDELKAQGHINTLAYSLWLDDPKADTGSILFGGVDSAKYEGSLVALPIQLDSRSNSISSFTVAWTGFKVTGTNINDDLSPSAAVPAILDSGTSLTYLPDDIVQQLFTGLGVISDGTEYNLLPCSYKENSFNLEYEFGGPGGAKIIVPIRELLYELGNAQTGEPLVVDGIQYCQFGIAPAGNYPILFGDTFLRSAYVVYDLENNEIGLAQTNFNANSGEQQVQVFSSGGGIPDSTTTASGASVEQTNTGRPPAGTQTGNDFDITMTALPTPTYSLTMASSTPDPNDSTGGAGTPNTSGSGSGSGTNAGSRLPADRTIFAAFAVTFGAFIFGTLML